MIDWPKGRADGKFRLCLNALLLQSHLGGIGNYTYQLSLGLKERHPDWEIYLLVHKGVSEYFRGLSGIKILEVKTTSRWLRLLYLHLFVPFRAHRFSLFHSVGNIGLVFGNARQFITIHDTYEHTSPERFGIVKRTLMQFMISGSGKKALQIFTNSANTTQDIARYYPKLAKKTVLTYLGTKFPVVTNSRPDGRNGFLFVGTIEPGKNLAFVLQAFAAWRREFVGRLSIVGAKGWKQSHIPGLITELGIQDSVDFFGYISESDLQGLYSRSIATIQASIYEGFGLPVIEAMACGCPVLSARNSGLVEAGGDAALFFPTNDLAGLTDLMKRIHLEAALREHCIRMGLAHALGFTWERTVSQTTAAYSRFC